MKPTLAALIIVLGFAISAIADSNSLLGEWIITGDVATAGSSIEYRQDGSYLFKHAGETRQLKYRILDGNKIDLGLRIYSFTISNNQLTLVPVSGKPGNTLVLKRVTPPPAAPPAAQVERRLKEETALDILKKRYAKGEITKEQFDEMKKDLLDPAVNPQTAPVALPASQEANVLTANPDDTFSTKPPSKELLMPLIKDVFDNNVATVCFVGYRETNITENEEALFRAFGRSATINIQSFDILEIGKFKGYWPTKVYTQISCALTYRSDFAQHAPAFSHWRGRTVKRQASFEFTFDVIEDDFGKLKIKHKLPNK